MNVDGVDVMVVVEVVDDVDVVFLCAAVGMTVVGMTVVGMTVVGMTVAVDAVGVAVDMVVVA
jgi:hypothetical protein